MKDRHSIGIIGTGWVGSSVAISTLSMGVADELILYDKREEVAEGEAMDLAHGSSFYPDALVRSAPPQEMLDTRFVVIAAGRGGVPGESRLDLLRENVAIVRSLADVFQGYGGIAIMVTNPVDVLTYEFQRVSGLPPERVVGTGTMLDTARLRQVLGRHLDLSPRSIHAQVVGEHGDSQFPLWSTATLGGIPLRQWPGWSGEQETKIGDRVRRAAQEIIRRKGATNHAIGLVTATLMKWMSRAERRILTISRTQTGAFGLRDLALSLPTIVGSEGALEVLEPPLDPSEAGALEASASVLRQAIADL